MLVTVSWVSFWLDPNAVPARVSLGVTTLLTMSTQTASINNSLPPVAYTKAIDVWTGVRLCYCKINSFWQNMITGPCQCFCRKSSEEYTCLTPQHTKQKKTFFSQTTPNICSAFWSPARSHEKKSFSAVKPSFATKKRDKKKPRVIYSTTDVLPRAK